jgi:hypothetical protein
MGIIGSDSLLVSSPVLFQRGISSVLYAVRDLEAGAELLINYGSGFFTK